MGYLGDSFLVGDILIDFSGSCPFQCVAVYKARFSSFPIWLTIYTLNLTSIRLALEIQPKVVDVFKQIVN